MAFGVLVMKYYLINEGRYGRLCFTLEFKR